MKKLLLITLTILTLACLGMVAMAQAQEFPTLCASVQVGPDRDTGISLTAGDAPVVIDLRDGFGQVVHHSTWTPDAPWEKRQLLASQFLVLDEGSGEAVPLPAGYYTVAVTGASGEVAVRSDGAWVGIVPLGACP